MWMMLSCCSLISPSCCTQFHACSQALLDELLGTFVDLRSLMRQHLEEEEAVALPLVRKHFMAKDVLAVEKQLIKGFKPADLAWYMRPMVGAGVYGVRQWWVGAAAVLGATGRVRFVCLVVGSRCRVRLGLGWDVVGCYRTLPHQCQGNTRPAWHCTLAGEAGNPPPLQPYPTAFLC